MSTLDSVFFYRSFFCLVDRQGQWQIFCTTYGYLVTGDGIPKNAKDKVDELLDLRAAGEAFRQNS